MCTGIEIFTEIKTINEKSFSEYGDILEKKLEGEKVGNNIFRIISRSKSDGWRAAYLIVRDRLLLKLENHPDSKETFEPVKGSALLCVAPKGKPEKAETFILDKAVVLNEGVWHGILTLSEESEVKICENNEVGIEYFKLSSPIRPAIIHEE